MADVRLKTPTELPDADIVIYDGQCNFCLAQVQRLNRWDGGDRLAYLSLHDSSVTERFPELTHDEMMKQMYVGNVATGKTYGGASALRYLTRKLPRLWWAMPFLHIPFTLPIWQWLYNQFAKRRYKLSGKNDDQCDNDQCKIHMS